MTESQTFKKKPDFQSNDDYAVYVRENIQVRAAVTFWSCIKECGGEQESEPQLILCRWG